MLSIRGLLLKSLQSRAYPCFRPPPLRPLPHYRPLKTLTPPLFKMNSANSPIPRDEKFIYSTNELSALINNSAKLRILDASFLGLPFHKPRVALDEFQNVGRLPNSAFFDIDVCCDHSTDLPHMLPTMKMLDAYIDTLFGDSKEEGDSNRNSYVYVVYDSQGFFSAPRVWWTLKLLGYSKVFILNGGLLKWVAEGREVVVGKWDNVFNLPTVEERRAKLVEVLKTRDIDDKVRSGVDKAPEASGTSETDTQGSSKEGEVAAASEGDSATATEKNSLFSKEVFSLADVKNVVKMHDDGAFSQDGSIKVLDARPAGRFAGQLPEFRPGLPSGNIPHSSNIPSADCTEFVKAVIPEGSKVLPGKSVSYEVLKSSSSLKELFDQKLGEVKKDDKLLCSCGSGLTALVLYSALLEAKLPNLNLGVYDGSWTEYGLALKAEKEGQ